MLCKMEPSQDILYKKSIPVIDNYAFQNDLIFENRQGVCECRLFVFPASIKLSNPNS